MIGRASRTAYLGVYDTLLDWETGLATAHLVQNGFRVLTVGATGAPVTSKGGLRIQPALTLADISPEDAAVLILGGADLWSAGDELAPFAREARVFLDAGVPVAAICGATRGLAREGLLDDRAHTSVTRDYLEATGYRGGAYFRETDAVTDRNLITAGQTDQVAFAREVFRRLGVYRGEQLDAWYKLFQHSDTSAYDILRRNTDRRLRDVYLDPSRAAS